MAVQIPDPGTGNGQTGDNEYVFRKKVKDNFSDQNNAASRLVGTSNGNVVEMTSTGIASSGLLTYQHPNFLWSDFVESGFYRATSLTSDDPDNPTGSSCVLMNLRYNSDTQTSIVVDLRNGDMFTRTKDANGYKHAWAKTYTDRNTTLDGNGALKPSSPVLRVFNDRITGNHDGDVMGATYTKNDVGDYTISGTTGLRTDGWYVVIPNDMNGNPKVAIGTLDDTDGVITLKTYVRIFDMSTFKFVPDLEQPLDIPDGRWIDLRFNDLPLEAQEELPTDGV